MPADVSLDPVAEIIQDRERARAAGDPFADLCVLGTIGPDGLPGVRPLVLRDVGPAGVGLLVNEMSLKWPPLVDGRYECLLVWLAIRRQYRIRGGLAPMPEARIAAYWQQKAHGSRLLDLYYTRYQPQSRPVESRAAFLAGIDALAREYPEPDRMTRPSVVRGIYLVPELVEAWRGSPDRLHDRRLYSRGPAGWSESVLVP